MTIDDNDPNIATNPYISVAEIIGTQLCQQAFWFESKCNWVGRTMDATYRLENKTLGPDLYDGTSGIALFLAYLHEFTGREEYRVCSEGAIRHALCNIELIPSVTRFGFYSGQVGVAYAAVKIGVLFNEDKLLESALDIV